MLLFSLSLSLPYIINSHYSILLIISSFCLITNQNLINYSSRNILLILSLIIIIIIILIDRFDLILMLHKKISSSSSKSTYAFDTSSIQTNNSKEKIHSIICFDENNFNQNANDIDENLLNEKKPLYRLVQSSTDIKINDLYSSLSQENSSNKNRAIRIESALMTSDYSHLLNHSIKYPSRSIMNINMNRTIDIIKRNDGGGDENFSSPLNDKQIQTTSDHNHYLTLEQVSISNRRKIQLTSKQLILISISVFVSVILLCLIGISFIF